MCDLAIIAAIAGVASAGTSIVGLQEQKAVATEQAAYKNAVLRNQGKVVAQDIKAETEAERLRQRLLSEAGATQEGDIVVAQANLGQVVQSGSAGDITAELAGEVAFKKKMSQHASKLRIRNLNILAGDLQGAMGLNELRRDAQVRAATIGQFSTVFSTGAQLASTFTFEDGNFGFRTPKVP
tara:strand:+ start:8378 stop:8923 length:546 start_codon:yes stop_codon:yes gene_type:complete